jgi:hypothetical protein
MDIADIASSLEATYYAVAAVAVIVIGIIVVIRIHVITIGIIRLLPKD